MRDIKFRAWDKNDEEMVYDFHKTYEFIDCLSLNEEWELMQYTGLKDKNGKEIYEGDILDNDGIIQIVEYKYGGDYYTSWIGYELYQLPDLSDTKVIGNIYENPELIK